MPMYHFHVHDGARPAGNGSVDGTVLPGIAEAKDEAVRFAAALLLESPQSFWTGEEWAMDVTDAAGLTLFTLTFFAIEAPAMQRRE